MKKAVKYDPIFCEQLIEHCRQGFSIETFASKIGCSRAAIYQWKNKYEEFADAHEKGVDLLRDRVIQRLHSFADGTMPRNASVVAAIFLAKNLGFRDDTSAEKEDESKITLIYGEVTDPDAPTEKKH